jgi:hypothetical protein
MSFPQTAPNVDDIFEPVTWHHQRRPFIRALTCKTGKTRRGVAGGASSDDQVSPMFVRRGEREIPENNELPFYNFYTPFLYPYVLYVSFTPVKHRAPCRRLISSLTWFDWFHKYWRLPATKVIVQGPILSGVQNPTWRANLAPPWVGEEYSLTNMMIIWAENNLKKKWYAL